MTPEELDRAITEVLSGNPDAYTPIFTEYMQKLYRIAVSLCGSPSTAEELVQDTLIDGYVHLSALREPEKIESWLTRILKNKYLNLVSRSRKNAGEAVLLRIPDGRTPERLTVAREELREWKERLDSLSPALRETAVAYFWERQSMEEIARRQKLPLGTVKRRIHDAREALKKEYKMNENTRLPDSFAQAVAEKIRELENYVKITGSKDGFGTAYGNLKKLIANLSYEDDVKKYETRGAEIAAATDRDQYAEEALAVYKKHGEAEKASWLYLDLCWEKHGGEKEAYTLGTILPALEEFPENEEKHLELGDHLFWLAKYCFEGDNTRTPENLDKAEGYLHRAMAEFEKTTKPDAMLGCVISGLKTIRALREAKEDEEISTTVTGERWKVENGNLYYSNQPGADFFWNSALNPCTCPVFYYAGYSGDRWFFSREIELIPGASEDMKDTEGKSAGRREVIAVDETVVTPAGEFRDCVHLRKTENNHSVFDIWYQDGVGLVKLVMDTYGAGNPDIKELASYSVSGEGLLPLAVGNTWRYVTAGCPEGIDEINEYVIERYDGEYAALSCFNYASFGTKDAETCRDPKVRLGLIDKCCDEKKYDEAYRLCKQLVIDNLDRESVDMAAAMIEYLDEKLPYDRLGWRFCPSSIGGGAVTVTNERTVWDQGDYCYYNMGVWGSQNGEDRIFGVKVFRYLMQLCGALWDARWKPGFTEERSTWCDDDVVHLSVEEGGEIVTPVGTFPKTLHLIVDVPVPEAQKENYWYYFYDHPQCGRKEFWFAEGVGVVRFYCDWGGVRRSDALLTRHDGVAADGEWMPLHIGSRWTYEEQTLTKQGYIARSDMQVRSGRNGKYFMTTSQFFTYRGNVEEYEEFKKTLVQEP